MFGYIKAVRAELRVREYDYYRASYCGLCRAMGRCTGQCSRLLLSYDFAFLVNVRMALLDIKPTFRRRRCLVHPFRPRVMMERNGQLDYAAHAAAILAYEKCRDDVADERGFARLGARLRCLLLHGAYRRARRSYPELARSVRACIERLGKKEAECRPSVDEVAAIFGDLMEQIMATGLEGERERIARHIGRQVGRFIYIVDAADDLDRDKKKNRFNPFLLLYGGEFAERERQDTEVALLASLADLEEAFDLLDNTGDITRRAVLENILYLGMPATIRQVLYKKKTTDKENIGEQQSI